MKKLKKLTPGADIDSIDFVDLESQATTKPSDILLNLFETSEDKAIGGNILSKKCANLEKRNHSLSNQNQKLQKQIEEIRKLNVFYQKRYQNCSYCTKSTVTAPQSNPTTTEPTANPEIQPPTTSWLDEVSLTSSQIALLERHLNPLRMGMLVGELAAMILSDHILRTKTASALDPNKLNFMMGKLVEI